MRSSLFVIGLGCSVAAFGCASRDKKEPETYLGLASLDAKQGFQVRSIGEPIPPGQDLEFCEVAELPGTSADTYYVNELECGNGENSHHLIISAAAPGSDAEAALAQASVGDRVPCLSAEGAYGRGFEPVCGIQRPYGRETFPAGVGRVYHGGQRIVFDYHYYNTSSTEVHALSAVNFHLTDAASVKHIARVFGFYNWTIDTPPHQQASFTGECTFDQDVTVFSLTRHTHRWGTDFTAWYAGGPSDQAQIFTSPHFEQNVDHTFAAPFVAKAGEGFRFRCDFDNTTDHALRFGVNATDEMCILFGQYWEAYDGQQVTSQDCSITQIDPDGIGRPASGDFRPPTTEERTTCLASYPSTGACADCACSTCGGVIADCFADADCTALLECVQATGCDQSSCTSACGDVFNTHSSAIGMLIQVGSCFSGCSTVCGTSGDGGTTDAAVP